MSFIVPDVTESMSTRHSVVVLCFIHAQKHKSWSLFSQWVDASVEKISTVLDFADVFPELNINKDIKLVFLHKTWESCFTVLQRIEWYFSVIFCE